ncbi:MAG: hypothetical protein DRJ09_02345 [Bacteroidetes bacterium]|nr:MAG: hypothetical protein DRJ09_02345 [Bacteroidota bacterium]
MKVTTAFIKIKNIGTRALLMQILTDNNITEFVTDEEGLFNNKADIIIADSNYFPQLCKTIKKLKETNFLPVLAITDEKNSIDVQNECITDFLETPINKQVWAHRINTFLSIRRKELDKADFEPFGQLFDSLFMAFPCPAHMVDTKLNIVRTNKKLLELTGKKQEDIVGKKCYEIYQNRKQVCDNCTVKKVLEVNTTVHEEDVHIFAGDKRYFEKSAYPLYNENKEIVYVVETAKEVTEKVNKQLLIEQGEENFRKFIEESSDLIILFNKKGIIRFVNKQVEKYGYTLEEILNTSILNYVVRDKAKQTAKLLDDLFNGKVNSLSFENDILTKEDRVVPMISNDVLIYFEGEQLDLSVLKDISSLKKIEKQLRDNSETLTNIFNNSVVAIYVQEKDGTFLDVNRAAMAMYGYKSKDQLIGKNPSIISDNTKNDLEEVKKYMELAFKGEAQSFMFWGKRVDGTSFPKYVTIEKGSYYGKDVVFAYAIDITDWHATQKQLEEREENYRAIVENIHDGLYIYNGKELNFVNDQLCEIIGFSKEEMFQKDVWNFFHPEDRERIKKNTFARLAGKNIPVVFSSKIITKSGDTKYGEFMVRRITYQGKPAIMGAVRDVTENVMSKQQLIEAKDKAEENSRLKSAFLNNMNHELRTPMNAIMGFSELMDKADPDQKTQFAGIIRNSAKQLLSLMDDVLYLSRLQSERLPIKNNYFSPCQVVNDIVKMFTVSNQNKNINIVAGNPDNLRNVEIYADESKIRQIITNFTSNAVKHTFEGSVEVGFFIEDKTVEYYVKDTGIGIPKDEQTKIFETFYRGRQSTSAAIRGTGLGLSIAQQIVEQLDGEINLSSDLGRGSYFSFSLPLRGMKTVQTQKTDSSSEKTFKGWENIIVLVAEDDSNNFFFYEAILKKKIKQLDHAWNGRDAVAMTKKNNYDLIFMDIKMPIMDGLEATRIIKAEFPDLPVIAQTAYTSSEERKSIMDAGCDEYISKPVNKQKLLNILQRYALG